jgi:hypothetical protein
MLAVVQLGLSATSFLPRREAPLHRQVHPRPIPVLSPPHPRFSLAHSADPRLVKSSSIRICNLSTPGEQIALVHRLGHAPRG